MLASSVVFRRALNIRAMAHQTENVSDYPRPPRLEKTSLHLRVLLNGQVIADTTNSFRVLETHHPPTYYIPPSDVIPGVIQPSPGGETMCEWKGRASYFDVTPPPSSEGSTATVSRRVWAYLNPTPEFKPIAGYYSFYASPFECYVDGEKVEAQPGNFYGGWKTSWIEGAIKGAPGTNFW
jgi:uncharacterized protein (DUF427 family)